MHNKSVLFISAFKDLNRGEWDKGFTRPVDTYLKWFSNLTKLPIRLICYCEESIKTRLHSELEFFNTYPYEPEDTFLKFLDKEADIMNSSSYKDLVKRRNDPETNRPGYNLVNHNKVVFIKRAANMFPGYTHYAWIDFGYLREEIKESVCFDFNILSDNITFAGFSRPHPSEIKTPREYCIDPGNTILQGSHFILKKEDVEWYYEEYYKTVILYFNEGLVDDDQAIVLQIYKNNFNKFNIILTSCWFDLLDKFRIPFCIDVVIPTCEKDIHSLDIVIDGLKQNVENVRNVYVVCKRSLSDKIKGGIFIDEESYPFSVVDIIETIFKTNSSDSRGSPGWFLQQLLKLYSFHVIKGISNNILIVDSETIFYNKYVPIKNNISYYSASNEINDNYRSHMKFLLPYIDIYSNKLSGICHQMLFQTHILQNLFDRVCQDYKKRNGVNLPFWMIILLTTTKYKCVYSEYDLYFNFMLQFHKKTIQLTNEIRWDLTNTLENTTNYTYLTAHTHLRGNENLKANKYYVSLP